MSTTYPLNWDLDSLLANPHSSEFEQLLTDFAADLQQLLPQSQALPPITPHAESATAWRDFLGRYERLTALAGQINAFIGCHAADDAGNRFFHALEARLAALQPLQATIAANLELALRETDDATLDAFLQSDPQLREIGFFFEDAKRRARLRFPSDLERFVAELDVDGFSAWSRLYDRLSGQLRIRVMERGEIVEKSPSQVTFDSPDRSVRENNFHASEAAWKTIAETCADALNHLAGNRLTKYRQLGLADHLEAPLLLNRMRRETLDQMWAVVAERRPVLVRYLNAKARLLGLDRLSWFDLNAPLTLGVSNAARLSYDAACDTVLQTFHGFSPDFGEFGAMALRDRWVEAENRPGKRQGGFCTDLPRSGQSRIFMTFTDSADSMSTLAHELGHAYHSHVLRAEPFFLRDYPMNLAETASTFAEHVLGRVRLEQAASDADRLAILDAMLGDAVAFAMNIHTRFVFENELHQRRATAELSPEELSEMMRAAQRACYCDALAEDGYHPLFWASKLHFYITEIPFYNFPYTFGYLLSLGLFSLAQDNAADFPDRYASFLKATGRETAEAAVAKTFGHDLTSPHFWHTAFNEIEQRVTYFETLTQTHLNGH